MLRGLSRYYWNKVRLFHCMLLLLSCNTVAESTSMKNGVDESDHRSRSLELVTRLFSQASIKVIPGICTPRCLLEIHISLISSIFPFQLPQIWNIKEWTIYSTRARMIVTSFTGLSCASVLTNPICLTTLIPSLTRPKIVCLPSRWGVGASVMKNCDPLVLGPELAMLRIPAPVCFKAGWISSANFSLQMLIPLREW